VLKIGLTGGIGSGKSTVATHFAALGVTVLDADEIAREVVCRGSEGLAEVVRCFGPQVLSASGELDRRQMRTLVFDAPDKRLQLEAILHPRILNQMEEHSRSAESAYTVWVVPLLLEAGWRIWVDRVLVIDASEATQLTRACQRDGASRDQVRAIIATQFSRDQRLAAADDVIVNEDRLDGLAAQVESLHHRYLGLAATRSDN